MASQNDETRRYSTTGFRGRRPVEVGRTLPRRRHLRRPVARPIDADRRGGVLLVLGAAFLAVLFVAGLRFGPLGAGSDGVTGLAPTPTSLATIASSAPSASASPPATPVLPSGAATQTASPATQAPPPPSVASTRPAPGPTAPPAPTPAPTTSPRSVLSPQSAAVVAFYDAVEAHDWDTAIGLWSASMQRRYPPDEWLIGRFSHTTRIDILSVHLVASSRKRATVAVTIREYRTVEPSPRTFVGDWDLVLVDGRWLLDDPDF